MEIEPVAPQVEELAHEQGDPRPEVNMLLSSLEEAAERQEALSPLLEDIACFMRENPDERFSLDENVPAGRLMTENDQIHNIYVILKSETLPRASKTFEVGNTTEEIEIGTIRIPTVIGEISKLLDGKATANVDLTSSATILTLSEEQFFRMSQSESFKQHHTDLANERLERQLDMMDRVDTLLGHRGDTNAEQKEFAETLGLEAAIQETLHNGEAMREFELVGLNRETREYKKQKFVASFTKTSNNGVSVNITGGDSDRGIIIPLKLNDEGTHVAVERRTANMGDATGYGFYSTILKEFLKKASIFESETTEPNALQVIDGYRSGETIPTSLLAAASPIFAARKDFISDVRGKEYGIMSYRVDTQLARILRLATDMERDRLFAGQRYIEDKYKIPKKDIARILLQLTDQYVSSEAPRNLHRDAQTPLHVQVARIKELCTSE